MAVKLVELSLENKNHVDFLFKCRTHPEVDKYLIGKPPADINSHIAWLSKNVGITRFFYIILFDDQMAGYCQLSKPENLETELGWVIHPEFQGRGVGKTAVLLLLQESERKGCKKATLEVLENNASAIHIYKKAGFTLVSVDDGLMSMEYNFA